MSFRLSLYSILISCCRGCLALFLSFGVSVPYAHGESKSHSDRVWNNQVEKELWPVFACLVSPSLISLPEHCGHGPSKGPAVAAMSPDHWEILRNEKAESPELPRGPKSVLQRELETKWTVTLIIIGRELSWLWGWPAYFDTDCWDT